MNGIIPAFLLDTFKGLAKSFPKKTWLKPCDIKKMVLLGINNSRQVYFQDMRNARIKNGINADVIDSIDKCMSLSDISLQEYYGYYSTPDTLNYFSNPMGLFASKMHNEFIDYINIHYQDPRLSKYASNKEITQSRCCQLYRIFIDFIILNTNLNIYFTTDGIDVESTLKETNSYSDSITTAELNRLMELTVLWPQEMKKRVKIVQEQKEIPFDTWSSWIDYLQEKPQPMSIQEGSEMFRLFKIKMIAENLTKENIDQSLLEAEKYNKKLKNPLKKGEGYKRILSGLIKINIDKAKEYFQADIENFLANNYEENLDYIRRDIASLFEKYGLKSLVAKLEEEIEMKKILTINNNSFKIEYL